MIKQIILSGCDDNTRINMDLTEEQIEFLRVIEAKSKEASNCNCQPVLKLRETGWEYDD
jgi:hypothetical protein